MAGYRITGPLGIGANCETIDSGTSALVRTPPPGPILAPAKAAVADTPVVDDDTRLLAATAFGEASPKNVFEEMAAIANVLVRQQLARKYTTIGSFIRGDKTFAFAAHDGNARYAALMAATQSDLQIKEDYKLAVQAARNALSANPNDYSGKGFFWDGADIKSNYENHPKVAAGIHFSDPAHNIYDIKETTVPGEEWWRDAQGKKTKLRGSWQYKFESTAAWGGTIFWKYSADFLKATGNKEYN